MPKPTVSELLSKADELLKFELDVNPKTGLTYIKKASGEADYKNAKEACEAANAEFETPVYKPYKKGKSLKLADCYALWFAVTENTANAKTKTIKRRAIADLEDFFSQQKLEYVSFDQISRQTMHEFVTHLRAKQISDATIANKFIYIKQFFDEIIKDRAQNQANPAIDVFSYKESQKIQAAEAKGWRKFEIDELKNIFSPTQYKNSFTLAYHFFPPLLSLFSGCRITEICQLYVADIVEVDGIKCFSINRDGLGVRLKNNDSKRLIPIHSRIAETGFYEYLSTQKERIFPELKLSNINGAGNAVSKKFSNYLRQIKLEQKGNTKIGAHSFRDTVINRLEIMDVPDNLQRVFTGHVSISDKQRRVFNDSHEIAYKESNLKRLSDKCLPALNWPELEKLPHYYK